MRNKKHKIIYLNATRLHRALIAGIQQVISREDYLNQINVFPVADRDTGTNMAQTLHNVIEETTHQRYKTIKELMTSIADAALNGSRGNSGAIIAQFFQGMSESAPNSKKISSKEFGAMVAKGDSFARQALSNPKEGTILSVLTAFSNQLNKKTHNEAEQDFVNLMHEGLVTAEESLTNTTQQLDELRKAKVVDAGAQGLVDLIKGVYSFITHGKIRDLYNDITYHAITKPVQHMTHESDPNFRYCTECLIEGEDINHKTLRQQLETIGDSLIVAGSSKKTKIHIHTNEPANVFSLCHKYGSIFGEKADDMAQQIKTTDGSQSDVAILTDSGADIPDELIKSLDIHTVPIFVNFGKQTYIDKISINTETFYKKLIEEKQVAKTSQPSFANLHRQYQFLSSHYKSIIAIHIPKKTSGTLGASQSAAKKTANKNIAVIDGLAGSAGLGLIVIHAAKMAKANKTQQEILKSLEQVTQTTQFSAVIPDLDYAVRGGRVSATKKRILSFFNLTPIMAFGKDGAVALDGVFFGKKNLPQKMCSRLAKKLKKGKKYHIGLAHTNREQDGKKLKENIENQLSDQVSDIFLMDCGAALAAHVGPGALGVAFLEDNNE